MILDNTIKVKVNTRNISYLKNVNSLIKLNDLIDIDPMKYPFKKGQFIINVKCDVCNNTKEIKWENYIINTNFHKEIYCCSEKCSIVKRNNRNVERYGVENVFQLNSIKEKIKNTMLEKYGVDSAIKYPPLKEKIKNTMLEKYGVENPFNTIDRNLIKKHRLNILFESIKKKYESNVEIIGYNDDKEYICNCKKCEESFIINNNILRERVQNNKIICTICFPIYSSHPEKEIESFLNDLNIKYFKKDRAVLKNLELDFLIEEKKLAIEFNGTYWHSSNWKNKSYHKEKFIRCENEGISLFQIWEDEWYNKKDIIKSILLNKFGLSKERIYARNCEIKIVDFKSTKNFLIENHIQGWAVSKINIGLFYKTDLVSLMTFGKKRISLGNKISSHGEYEMIRFCNKKNTSVVGSASKLFKFFIKNYFYTKIISYSNNDYSNGNIYRILGFEFIKTTNPGYFYIKNNQRKNRFFLRKQNLIKDGYDASLTENEITKKLNYLKIYNSGNKIFLFENKNPK